MSVQPIDFFNSALEYAETNLEINKRNALSRAYYACYHICNEFFPIDPSFIPLNNSAGTHAKYIEFLLTFGIGSKERFAGLELKKLLSRRRKADYDIKCSLRTDELGLQLATSKNLIKFLN